MLSLFAAAAATGGFPPGRPMVTTPGGSSRRCPRRAPVKMVSLAMGSSGLRARRLTTQRGVSKRGNSLLVLLILILILILLRCS